MAANFLSNPAILGLLPPVFLKSILLKAIGEISALADSEAAKSLPGNRGFYPGYPILVIKLSLVLE